MFRAFAEPNNNLEEAVCQTGNFDQNEGTERGLEIEDQIHRLQLLVSHLLVRNEQLRQQLATSLGNEGTVNSQGEPACITPS
jgi:hypothetical protein